MGFKQSRRYIRIALFGLKVAVSIFGIISDIIYYYKEEFKVGEIKTSMAFFILLSPLLQVFAWGILLSQIAMKDQVPEQNEKVKKSKDAIQYMVNYVSCSIAYYCKMTKRIILLLPYTVLVALLQETKLFPVFLFGYTYFKYHAVLTADLMKNISQYLERIEVEEIQKQEMEKRERAKSKTTPLGQQQNNQFSQKEQSSQNSFGNFGNLNKESNLNQLSNNSQQQQSSNQIIQKSNTSNKLKNTLIQISKLTKKQTEISLNQQLIESTEFTNQQPGNNPANIFRSMFEKSKRNKILQSLRVKNFILPQINNNNNNNNGELQSYNQQQQLPIKSTQISNDINSYLLTDNFGQQSQQNVAEKIKTDEFQQNQLSLQSNSVSQQVQSKSILELKQRNGKLLNIPLNQIDPNQINKTQIVTQINQTYNDYHNSIHNHTIDDSNENEDKEEEISKYGFSKIDVTLDANLLPTIDTLLIDKNFQQFILITDIVKAIFGALPMTIVKYMNNSMNGAWHTKEGNVNYFILLSFMISLLTIITHGIQLMGILYNENIIVYYKTLQYLNKMQLQNVKSSSSPLQQDNQVLQLGSFSKHTYELENLQNQSNPTSKKNSLFGFGRLFPMMKKLRISNEQIKKLSMLSKNACDEVKHLNYDLSNNTYIAANLYKHLKASLPKFQNLQQLVIKFNRNYQGEGLELMIQDCLQSKMSLKSVSFSFYQSNLKIEQIQHIQISINNWMVNNHSQITSVLFETELAFIWYPCQFDFDFNQFLLLDKMQEMILEDFHNQKLIFSINIPDKSLIDDESLIISESINRWQLSINQLTVQSYQLFFSLFQRNNLQQFQFHCRDISEKSKLIMKQTLVNHPSLQTYQFSTEKNEMVCSKGYEIDLNISKGTISIKDRNFYYNFYGTQMLLQKDIQSQWKLFLHTLNLDFQKQNKREGLSEIELKSIFNNIDELKFIKHFSINLENNNMSEQIGSIIGSCLASQPKLESISINFQGNKLTKIGFSDFMKQFISKQKLLNSLELNLNGCLISQEGIQIMGEYFKMISNQSQTQTSSKTVQFNKFKINLSENRINSSGINHLFSHLSQLQYLQSINLIIKGSILSNFLMFDFSKLFQLQEFYLTFLYNQFTSDGIKHFFSSLETLQNSIQVIHLDFQHNGLNNQIYPFLNFLSKINNLVELNLNLQGNAQLTQLPHVIEILMDQHRLLSFSLNICGCDFDYSSILQLKQGLAYLCHLKVLSLDFSKNKKFDDDCFLSINFLLQEIKTLEKLSIFCQETTITNQSIETLSYSLITFKTIQTLVLDFSHNNIDDNIKMLLRQCLVKAEKIAMPFLVI